jgi:hypothetical protein
MSEWCDSRQCLDFCELTECPTNSTVTKGTHHHARLATPACPSALLVSVNTATLTRLILWHQLCSVSEYVGCE